MKNTKENPMPLVKVIRHGQITLPKEVRNSLGIKEGDLLEVKMGKAGITIKPKTAIDKELAGEAFWGMVEEIRDSVKDADPEELEAAMQEAVIAAKKATARRLKTKAKR